MIVHPQSFTFQIFPVKGNFSHYVAPTHAYRSRWDALNTSSIARLSSLEESLLSLGQFEEAYDELWAWLTDALQQLENTEPITGDPDAVATQLSKHKVS